jgi:hypothetical protein
MNTPGIRPWRVLLPWEQADEGTFDIDVHAPDAETACLAAAAQMLEADTIAVFDSQAERDDWIRGRAEAALLVSDLRMDTLQSLRDLLVDELGLGAANTDAPEICWKALKTLARLHRRHLFAMTPKAHVERAYSITRPSGDGGLSHTDSLDTVHVAVHEARSQGGAYQLRFL